MKPTYLLIFLIFFTNIGIANNPDSAYVFAYSTNKLNNTAGLHFAWSIDKKCWNAIGPEQRFLSSDFGRWGTQKKLISPFLFQDKNGLYHCIWSLNKDVGQFAHAASFDLYNWKRQSYPYVMKTGNVLSPEISFDGASDQYIITWISELDGEQKLFKTYTNEFKNYSQSEESYEKDRLNNSTELIIDGEKQIGLVLKVPWSVINGLIKNYEWVQYHELERQESLRDDLQRFKNLEPIEAKITIDTGNSKAISDLLIGIFFEDINYAADGGLYAELVQNRGFEYDLSDKLGRDETWNNFKAWKFTGEKTAFTIDTVDPIHPNQKHYALLQIDKTGASLINEGFEGIPVKAGEIYDFSVFARAGNDSNGKLQIQLIDANGIVLSEPKTISIGNNWNKYEAQLIASKICDDAQLQITPATTGTFYLDMVSLFPKKTFKNRKNGLRADLAQTIADIHPRFVRFPGGCVAHGDGLANMYRWKNTIGPLEERKTQSNIWRYHQSVGLGYFEYFQFCEDINAEPIPVLPAGVPCQNSGTGGHGQQGGIPMCEMDDYVQEVLDLIEWANGDKKSKWGKLRAQAGHAEPFNLKYIGIGNEDLITDIFEERFSMIYKAVKEKHPEITVIGTVGPFYMGTDYEEGWDLATRLQVPMVDEHYYQPPGWYINNQTFYDKYDRSKSQVYLGEYAAHIPGRKMTVETALCEALHLINIERNGDIVRMTSFAPLLAKEGHTQWNPDLIYFNNTEVKPTVDYYVQKLFGQNSGDWFIPSSISLSNTQKDVKKRIAASIVHNRENKDYILKLVNILPVEVNASIDLEKLPVGTGPASISVLKGNPSDENSQPVTRIIQIDNMTRYQLPPYSLTVLKMHHY